jgi:hypothetical protein
MPLGDVSRRLSPAFHSVWGRVVPTSPISAASSSPPWPKSRKKSSQELYASRFVALLTDLLRLWIFDCYSNEKGLLPEASSIGRFRFFSDA